MPRASPPRMAPEMAPAPPIMTMMKVLTEIHWPSPALTPEMGTSIAPARPASIAARAQPSMA